MRIYITGMGCISPLGSTAADAIAMLRSGKDGLVRPVHLHSKYAGEKYFGEVAQSDTQLRSALGLDGVPGLTRTDLLAFTAFKEAVMHAGLTGSDIASPRTAFISASTVGGMCLTDQLYQDANMQSGSAEYVHSYNCAAHTLRISTHYAMKGISDTINTACSSSANAIMLGARLIRSGRADRAIVGGVDSLAKYTVNGFNALQILSEGKCRPFDEQRDGLNLGEAGAYLVLEAEHICADKERLAQITGYGNTNDAFHTSSMSDDAVGVTQCIAAALRHAGLAPDDISYINAHGTGTMNNDAVELTGFSNIFAQIPPYSSTKSYTGHTLGAAGALEAIFSVASIVHQEIYPSLRVASPIQGSVAPVSTYSANARIINVMSNSYGFGGNCTSLLFSLA